jgi:hypothetical protein
MLLTKASILAASDAKLIAHDVPDWGGTVYLRVMPGTERDHWERQRFQAKQAAQGDATACIENFRASLVVVCLCDDKGVRLFTDDDAASLGEKSGKVLDELYDVASKINGLSKADVQALVKN